MYCLFFTSEGVFLISLIHLPFKKNTAVSISNTVSGLKKDVRSNYM